MGIGERLDLITLGRSSVDLYGEQVGGRLEDMGSFAKYVGGSPTNTAIGAARLGLQAGVITRVGADHFGRFIREELQRSGVDISGVIADPERLTALAVLGIRSQSEFPLLFYRENCADMALSADDVAPERVARADAILINGTHLSRPGVFEASLKAARLAKAAGGKVVFDVDYRPVLWSLTARDLGENRYVASADVTARLQAAAPLCDLIVGTEEEFHILGGTDETAAALRSVRALTDATLVCKLGPLGCVAFPGGIETLESGVKGTGFSVEVFNVLGAGDAFMSGFLRGWLRGEPLATCCEWANACGAIVVSRHGCAPAMPTWPELQDFISRPHPQRLRDDVELEHIHWATTRSPRPAQLMALAVDHRTHFEHLAPPAKIDPARLARFKTLCLSAVDKVGQGDRRFGVLLDDRFGKRALELAGDLPYWIGRPIEQPGVRPLAFEGARDVGATLRGWPLNHVVKCLVRQHPDDAPALLEAQARQLRRLFSACRETRHELLLELIVPADAAARSDTVARALEQIYETGVRPDWWKLEPSQDAASWRAVEAVIEQRDPFCRGVVLLGGAASMQTVIDGFRIAAASPIVSGFAVGRTTFETPARDWLAGAISDEAAISALACNFGALVDGWRTARAEAGLPTGAA
ncbi:MAG TPA: 5-dehydro-2-deoxygluconokinase [Caulobacteraceae bacterium]|nr:5-dehydro-2-deoxygluconokinase [Caulobacteraceae bacterium]